MRVCVEGTFVVEQTCPNATVCSSGRCDDIRCPNELASASPSGLAGAEWPKFRHDNRNSGWSPVPLADRPKLKWKVLIGGARAYRGGLQSGAVIGSDGRIFIRSDDLDPSGAWGRFFSFDRAGKLVYAFDPRLTKTDDCGFALYQLTPTVRADGGAYFLGANLCQDSAVFALAPDGVVKWTFPSHPRSPPVLTDDGKLIFIRSERERPSRSSLHALDWSGKVVWKTSDALDAGVLSGGLALSCDGRVYVQADAGWRAFDSRTGDLLWTTAVSGVDPHGQESPVISADGTMFVVSGGAVAFALDPKGKVLWTNRLMDATPFRLGAGTSSAKIGDTLYVVLSDGKLHAVSALDGTERWSRAVGSPEARFVCSGPIVDGNMRIYFSSGDGNVYAFDRAGNELWRIPVTGKRIEDGRTSPATLSIGSDGTLYVPGYDGYLYAFQ